MNSQPSSHIDLDITGMSCASCVRRIETAITRIPGVSGAHVNLAERTARITVSPGTVSVGTLTAAIHEAGYEAAPTVSRNVAHAAHDHEAADMRREALIAMVLALPVVIIGMAHGAIPALEGRMGAYLQMALTSAAVFWPGRLILRPALRAARHAAADMNTLVSLGVLAAWGYSLVNLARSPIAHNHHLPLYFEAAAAIVAFVLSGKWLESRSRRRLSDAVSGLAALRPALAHRLRAAQEEQIAVEALVVGDRLLVRPGERFPADGRIEQGTSSVDAALVTGESMPEAVAPGGLVRAGTLNRTGALEVSVTAVGGDSTLGRILAAVETAQGSRAPIARLADRVSAIFVPIVLGIAVLTLATWLIVDASTVGIGHAIEHAVAVLVIACPCALGLATPAAVAVGTGRAAELGILFKGGAALETASRIDAVLVDKTGTLTTGRPEVVEVIALSGYDEAKLLALAAGAESRSEHPLAQAVARAAVARGLSLPTAQDVIAVPGKGLKATIDGKPVAIGTMRWFTECGLSEEGLARIADRLAIEGQTPVAVAMDGHAIGILGLRDQPAPQAQQALEHLQRLGIATAMVTGDRREVAQVVAVTLGIEQVHAEIDPPGKARIVAETKAGGHVVAMVGDGLNDAPALAGADLGIAIGAGTDVAQAAADVVLVHGIAGLPVAIDLARRTLRTIRRNLFWAFAYNMIGIPIAAGALVPLTGWTLSPALASAAMALSSVSVLMNSLRLRMALRSR